MPEPMAWACCGSIKAGTEAHNYSAGTQRADRTSAACELPKQRSCLGLWVFAPRAVSSRALLGPAGVPRLPPRHTLSDLDSSIQAGTAHNPADSSSPIAPTSRGDLTGKIPPLAELLGWHPAPLRVGPFS
jgi:hypothetical protein